MFCFWSFIAIFDELIKLINDLFREKKILVTLNKIKLFDRRRESNPILPRESFALLIH